MRTLFGNKEERTFKESMTKDSKIVVAGLLGLGAFAIHHSAKKKGIEIGRLEGYTLAYSEVADMMRDMKRS